MQELESKDPEKCKVKPKTMVSRKERDGGW
jgi:hypothetical protein